MPAEWTCSGAEPGCGSTARTFLASSCDGSSGGPITNWRRSRPARSMSTITQLAMSPASSRAHRCSVTASLNVLLSSSSLVTAVTMSIRRVMARTSALGSSAGFRASPAVGLARRFAGWPGLAAVTTSSRVPSCNVMTSAVRVASTGPSGPSSLHSTCLAVPGPRGRGELALDRGPRGQVDERGQRPAGRVPGRGADQVTGLAVRAPDRAVRLEHEQGRGRVLEHGPQQGSFRAERVVPGPRERARPRRLRPASSAPRRRRRVRRTRRRAGPADRRRASPRPGAAPRAAPPGRRDRRPSHPSRCLATCLLTIIPGETPPARVPLAGVRRAGRELMAP